MSSPEYVPLTIRGSSNKILKAFYQHIVKKIEPEIYSDWARKPGKKRRTESQQMRFVVATTAAFYVCKPGVITSVKIAQSFPWISIKSFSVDVDTHELEITFSEGSILVIIDDIISFTAKIFSYLRSILPLYFPIQVSLPPELGRIAQIPSTRVQIVDLYISQCKAMGQAIDLTAISILRHDMRKMKPFVINKQLLNDNQVEAMCVALMYSPLIKTAKLGGKNFAQLFSKAGHIISLNMGIQDLELFKHKPAAAQFEYFIKMMQRSSMQSLTLNDIKIDTTMSEFLAQNLPTLPISSLTLDFCQFGKYILNAFYKKINTKLSNLKELVVKNDLINSKAQVPKIIKLCKTSGITTLVLVEMQIDIADFFKELSSSAADVKLMTIDLSSNLCTSSYNASYTMPTTLDSLILRKTTWDGNSLITFLSKQVYLSMIQLDLSRADLTEEQIVSLINYLPDDPPSPSIRSFRWDNNPIFPKMLNFLSKLRFLQILTINNCYIPSKKLIKNSSHLIKLQSNSLIGELVNLVGCTNIQRLSINGTMKHYKSELMLKLKDVLFQHQTLSRLDVCDNKIGDDGIKILKDVVTINTRITDISFDGCEVDDYTTLTSFLLYAAQLPHLKNISKPRNEMIRLAEQHDRRVAKELKAAYAKVLEKHESMLERGREDSGTEQSTTSALISSAANETSVDVEIPTKMTYLEADWSMEVQLQYDGSFAEWEQLRNKYSFASLTGITAFEPSTDDLIDFETY